VEGKSVPRKRCKVPVLFVAVALAGILFAPKHTRAVEPWCDSVASELNEKQLRLNEYMQALQGSYDKRDYRMADALNYKIKQLQEELRTLEQEAADCEAHNSGGMAQGLSSSKTDEEKYATKSCGELRKMIFPLLIKTRSLKRREKSLIIGMTPEEETELATCSEQLKILRHILKCRCSGSTSRSSLLKRLRP
jgi:hypothetical protein